MGKTESKKFSLSLFLISLFLHLFVFAASSHEYVWKIPDRSSRPLKFRVVSVEKPEEKLPPNPQSRFLSTANRKESGSGKPGETPRLRREDRDLIPSRRGAVGAQVASLAPAPKSKVPPPAAPPVSPKPPAAVTPEPQFKKVEKAKERKAPEVLETKETPKPIETESSKPAPEPSPKVSTPVPGEKIKPKAKPKAEDNPEKKKREIKTLPKDEDKPKPVVKKKTEKEVVEKKPRKENEKVEAKIEITDKPKVSALPPAPKPQALIPVVIPEKRKPPVVATPKPEPKETEKSQERKALETLETKETPKPKEMARLAPTPEPLPKPAPKPSPSPVLQEKIKPKAKPKANEKPVRKKIEAEAIPKIKNKPGPVVKKKAVKKVVKKKVAKEKPREENKKVEAKKQTKEEVELAALKPVSRPIQPLRPSPKRSQLKDPLALFRVKPQPGGKPKLPKFDLSDEAADRIAKRSLSDKDSGKEEGETISLDTRDFRYASYFAHIKRRIQNAWIWPAEAQKNRGELLLRFKLRKNGTLEEVRLIKSAGIRILDDLAMAAVTKAAPFEPFPEGLERKSITATFVYE